MPVSHKVKVAGSHTVHASKKIARSVHRTARAVAPHAKKVAHKTTLTSKKIAKNTAHHTKRAAKAAHKQIAQKPHNYLIAKVPRYKKMA